MSLRDEHARIVIVGAGHAGGQSAAALRAAGHRGPLTLIGTEAHPPYERPPLSKELLGGTMAIEKTYLRTLDWYESAGVTLRSGTTVLGIERRERYVMLADGSRVPYDRLVLATGARARRLAVPGADGPNVFYLRDIADALAVAPRLREGTRLAVIGAGFVGLEIAATARRRGAYVSIFETAAQPLARVVSTEFGFFFADLHQRNGVGIKTGVSIDSIAETPTGVKLYTNEGDAISADLVVVGIGAVPNTELASMAGLSVDDGIIVDQWGRSSDPLITAVGDVSRHFNPLLNRHVRLESWHNAQNQPLAVAQAMLGVPQPYAEVPWFWTDQYDVNFQLAGAPLKWEHVVKRGQPYEHGFMQFFLSGAGVPVGAIAINNGRDMRWARQMIGRGQPVDAAALADSGRRLQDLAQTTT